MVMALDAADMTFVVVDMEVFGMLMGGGLCRRIWDSMILSF